MRGIVLAGGSGTRLLPSTAAISKQLLPVYDKPMIYYPISILMLAGITEILIITTPHDQDAFKRVLGSGKKWGLRLDYAVQPSPGGLPQAYIIGSDFVRNEPSCLILGDNILFGSGLAGVLRKVRDRTSGATVFAYWVEDPHRYGVVDFDDKGSAVSIEEKPEAPRSNWAVTGLYFYDGEAVEIAKSLKPSARGELEISDLNSRYLSQGKLSVEKLGRGYAWFDAGTHDSLLETSEFVKVLQHRQGQSIACLEEIAFDLGLIGMPEVESAIKEHGSSSYVNHLRRIQLEEKLRSDTGFKAETRQHR